MNAETTLTVTKLSPAAALHREYCKAMSDGKRAQVEMLKQNPSTRPYAREVFGELADNIDITNDVIFIRFADWPPITPSAADGFAQVMVERFGADAVRKKFKLRNLSDSEKTIMRYTFRVRASEAKQ